MTTSALDGPRPGTSGDRPVGPADHVPRMVVVDRGDALVPHLTAALSRRFQVVGRIHAELTPAERLLVAASTFRPTRRAWVERFFKSNLSVRLRSRLAARQLARTEEPYDLVFQTHALFQVRDRRAVLYVDCTHRQSAEQWPDWNPLRGRALRSWYARERQQYHQAAHVFAFSQETAASLVEHYGVPAERVSVVGAGVNFDGLPTTAPEHRPAVPTVLFVGNDFERKGGQVLLEAFRVVRRRLPEARLRLVGEPHGIVAEPGVEVLGRVGGREEMSRIYAEASVFALPSVFDPFGLVVLEAMAHGLPCVVTPTCGLVEIVVEGETGRFLDSVRPSAEALAEVLLGLLGDSQEAARMGAAGRRRVEEHFLWPQVVDRMAPVLERLAPDPDAGRSGPPIRAAVPGISPATSPAPSSTRDPLSSPTPSPADPPVSPARPSSASHLRGARP